MKRICCFMIMVLCFIGLGTNVSAEEIHTELSTLEEFSQWSQSDSSTYSTLTFVRRTGIVGGADKITYFSLMEIDGTLVYCIEPYVYAATGQNYEIDWGVLNESTKQRLFRITNVGYGRYGHNDDRWFVATQLAVWRALGYTQYYAQTMDGTYWDLSAEIAEIEQMANSFGNTASFSGQTLTLDLNEPCTVKDSSGVLSQFQVQSVKGVDIVQNGNEMTVTIVDRDYQKSLSGSKGITTGGLVYVHPGKQTVYMVHRSEEPISYHLNLKLNTKDLVIVKQDTSGQIASGVHTFELLDEQSNTVLDHLTIENGRLEVKGELVKGKYWLKETSTTFPYVLSDEMMQIDLSEKQHVEVIFVNDVEKIDVQILKKDDQTKQLLDGAVFEVSVVQNDKKELLFKKKAEAGYLNFEVPYGKTIQVCEVEAPAGYQMSSQCQTVEIRPDKKETVQIEFLNCRKEIPVILYKKDAETDQLLEGAVFEVTGPDGSATVTSTKTGTTLSGFHYGDQITVCEVTAPAGYELSLQPCQSVILSEDSEILEFENRKRRISVEIVKLDEKTGMKLDDAEFTISLMNASDQWEEIYRKTTGGNYLYIQDAKQKELSVFKDEEKQSSLGVRYVDEMGFVDVADLNEFEEVYAEVDGKLKKYPILNFNGMIRLPEMVYGSKLQICETRAPEGYELNESGCQIVILTGDEDNQRVVFENTKRLIDVYLMKHDADDFNLLLNDAYFRIENLTTGKMDYRMSGRLCVSTFEDGFPVSVFFQVYRDDKCTDLIFEAQTDETGEWIGFCDEKEVYVTWNDHIDHFIIEKGTIVLEDVTYGDVLNVCEVIAPSGYHRKEECQLIEVKSSEPMLQIWLENERIRVYDEVPAMGTD